MGPRFIVVAGPNGAGKSTFTKARRLRLPVIDPDAIAAQHGVGPVQAGRMALRQVDDAIRTGTSIIVETTLSGRSYLLRAQWAKDAGFRVELHYIGVDWPEVSIVRVAERVARGGHDVPEEDIRRRFERSLRNLPDMIALCDVATLYDNMPGDDLAGYVELARFTEGCADIVGQRTILPWWAREVLEEWRKMKKHPHLRKR